MLNEFQLMQSILDTRGSQDALHELHRVVLLTVELRILHMVVLHDIILLCLSPLQTAPLEFTLQGAAYSTYCSHLFKGVIWTCTEWTFTVTASCNVLMYSKSVMS